MNDKTLSIIIITFRPLKLTCFDGDCDGGRGSGGEGVAEVMAAVVKINLRCGSKSQKEKKFFDNVPAFLPSHDGQFNILLKFT